MIDIDEGWNFDCGCIDDQVVSLFKTKDKAVLSLVLMDCQKFAFVGGVSFLRQLRLFRDNHHTKKRAQITATYVNINIEFDREILTMQKSSDENYLFSSHKNLSITQWQINKIIDPSDKKIRSVYLTKFLEYGDIHMDSVWSIALSKNGNLYTSSWDGHIKIWSTTKRTGIKSMGKIMEDINHIELSKDEKFLIISDAWGCLKIFNRKKMQLVKDLGAPHDDSIMCIATSF